MSIFNNYNILNKKFGPDTFVINRQTKIDFFVRYEVKFCGFRYLAMDFIPFSWNDQNRICRANKKIQ